MSRTIEKDREVLKLFAFDHPTSSCIMHIELSKINQWDCITQGRKREVCKQTNKGKAEQNKKKQQNRLSSL